MRSHALLSWLLLTACSYDFGGAGPDGFTGTGGGANDGTSTASGSTLPLGTTASSTSAAASSSQSSTTGVVPLPDPIPPCGGFTDDFEDDLFDDTIWSRSWVDGDVREELGYLQLQTFGGSAPIAQLELKAIPVAPCSFGFAIDFDTMTVALRSADGLHAIGLTSMVSGNDLLVHRDGVDGAPPSERDAPDGIAVVLLAERVVLLVYEDEEDPWIKILDEPRVPGNDWASTAKASVFTRKANELAEVDDYGVKPVHPSDL